MYNFTIVLFSKKIKENTNIYIYITSSFQIKIRSPLTCRLFCIHLFLHLQAIQTNVHSNLLKPRIPSNKIKISSQNKYASIQIQFIAKSNQQTLWLCVICFVNLLNGGYFDNGDPLPARSRRPDKGHSPATNQRIPFYFQSHRRDSPGDQIH